MYLGIDLGTSSVKLLLVDDAQRAVDEQSAPLDVSRPHPGWSEQNPEDWWKAAGKVVAQLRKLKPKAVAAVEGIGLSGQQHGATLIDKDGKVRNLYRVPGLPTTYFIDKTGKIASVVVGPLTPQVLADRLAEIQS